MKKIRAFRPAAEYLDDRIAAGDLGVIPPPVDLRPVPLLTPAPDPAVVPVPLLTLPCAPVPNPAPAPVTGPVLATISVGGQVYRTMGATTGDGVMLNTTPLPSGPGTVTLALPDGTTARYECIINATDRLQGIQSETDADGQSYMYLPCRCTVPAIYPANLGVSA